MTRKKIKVFFTRSDQNLSQGHDGENVISTLRNGSAAVNAAALMKERGYTNRRRSRHRLTPGTVKFAAFHVLSLEGSKGLTILDVAEKIQVHTLICIFSFLLSPIKLFSLILYVS